MKRILIALLTCVALAGCGYGNHNGTNNGTDNGANNGTSNGPSGNTGTNGGTGGAGANGEATPPQNGAGTQQQNGPAGGTAGGNSMNDKGGASGAATSGSVAILHPAEDATVSSKQPVELQYRVEESTKGDHVHISVDNGKPDIVRALSGTYQIAALSPGDHAITVAEVTRNHVATGNQATLHLHVE
jgi:hypothetical protein